MIVLLCSLHTWKPWAREANLLPRITQVIGPLVAVPSGATLSLLTLKNPSQDVCVCVCVNNLITLVNQELQGWYSSLFKNYIEFSGVWENKNSFVCFLVRSISSRVLNPYCCQSAYPISLTLSIFLLPRNIPRLSSVIKMSLPLLIFWWLHPLVLKE